MGGEHIGLALPAIAPEKVCSSNPCTSPGGNSGLNVDCWGGTASEGCTCSAGAAVVTGESYTFGFKDYVQYKCCPDGAASIGEVVVGVECGNFKSDGTGVDTATDDAGNTIESTSTGAQPCMGMVATLMLMVLVAGGCV